MEGVELKGLTIDLDAEAHDQVGEILTSPGGGVKSPRGGRIRDRNTIDKKIYEDV